MAKFDAKKLESKQLRKVVASLKRVRGKFNDRLLKDASRFGFAALANIKKNYLTGPRPGKVGVVTGRLRASMLFTTRKTSDGPIIRFGTNVKYAALHEFGGTVHPKVTQRMRKWAWARYFETGEGMFKAIALTKKSQLDIKIEKRPFLVPGVHDKLDAFKKIILKTTKVTIRDALRGNV